jgi:catechol 2,3-dioxygenase-like lactoylglutathione lyase family enzyme
VAKVHHSAIVTRDVESSLVFWRDGLGLEVLMDHEFEGPWPELFGAQTRHLRSVFLGETGTPESGIVELVVFEGRGHSFVGADESAEPGPAGGFFLLSLHADLDTVLPRLAALRVGGEPSLEPVGPVRLAVVHDPNGVRVELMDRVEADTSPPNRTGELP